MVPKTINLEVFDQEEEDNADIPAPTFQVNAGTKDSLATPKLGSLKDIQKRAARSIKSSPDSAVELKIETFEKSWQAYLQTVELPTLKAILAQADLSLHHTRLMIKVGSNHSKSTVGQRKI